MGADAISASQDVKSSRWRPAYHVWAGLCLNKVATQMSWTNSRRLHAVAFASGRRFHSILGSGSHSLQLNRIATAR
jgi:hypothetical protein